jgi:hypothetical protein
VPSDNYWKGTVKGLGSVVYDSAEWRVGFKYNELGECTWEVLYIARGAVIDIDEGYEVSIAKARMRVNRVLANVQHYRDENLPPNLVVPSPLPNGEWKLPQWEDAPPVAFSKPEYTNVKSIYELEYKWSKLNAARENGPLADRAERALAIWTGQLDKALNKELALMQRIFRAWLDARPNDSDDLTVNARLADKLRAIMVTHATHPIPPEIVSGIFAAEPRTIDDILVQLPPRSPIRHAVASEYYTWLSRNKARMDTWKSVENMLRLIDDAQSLPINEKIVVFHRALTTAHNNGRMPEHLYGGGDGMTDRDRDANRVLTHLSNMKIPPEWDAELKELLSLPRGASMRMRLTADGMLTLYHYAPDDFDGGVLDPSRFGAGTYTSRDLRASDVPRVFFYLNPGDREQWFTGRRLFSAQVPASSIFDIENGDPKVLDASRTSSGRIDPHELFLNVKGAGYKGIKYDAGGMPLVAYFEPIAVEPVQQEKFAQQQQQFGAQPPPLGQSPQPFPQAQQQAQQQPQAQQKPADTGQSSVGLQPLTDPSQKVNNPLMDVGLDSGGQVRVAPPGSGLVTQQVGTINNPGQQLSLKMPATTPAAQQVTDALSGADVGNYKVLIDNAQSGMDVQQLAKSSAKGKKSNKAYLDHDINPVTGELEWVLRSPHGVDVRWFGHMKPTPETVEAARRGGIVDRVFESESDMDTDTVGKDEMAQALFGPMGYEPPDDHEVAAIEFAHADISPNSQKLLRSKDTWPQRTTYHNDSKVTGQALDDHDLVSGGVGYSNIMAVMSEATPQEIESYGLWYGLGHDQALMISEESGVPLDRVCAVIALLSPGIKWENNLQAARRLCLGEPLAGSGGAFPMNVLKALRVLRGASVEKTMATSEKVLPFYETLLSPEKSAEKAVVDRHMFAIWFGDPSIKMVDDPSVRVLIQRDVQLAAREWNMPVQAIQAITWAIWRQRTNIPRPDDELHPNDPDAPPSDYDYDLMKQGELQASKRLAMPGSFSMDAFDLFGDDGVEAVTEVAPLVIGDQFKLDGKGPVFEVLNAKSGGDQWILVRPSTHKRLAYEGKFNRSTAIVTLYDKAMATVAEGKMTPVPVASERNTTRIAMSMPTDEFAQRLRMTLTPDLLKPEWRKEHETACDPMTGHCYAAAEAAYHALGGAEAGWKPMHIKHEDAPHWYLQHADGTVFDPTASQFQEPPDYAQGRGKGFLTKAPSARARKILERMQSKTAQVDENLIEAVVKTVHGQGTVMTSSRSTGETLYTIEMDDGSFLTMPRREITKILSVPASRASVVPSSLKPPPATVTNSQAAIETSQTFKVKEFNVSIDASEAKRTLRISSPGWQTEDGRSVVLDAFRTILRKNNAADYKDIIDLETGFLLEASTEELQRALQATSWTLGLPRADASGIQFTVTCAANDGGAHAISYVSDKLTASGFFETGQVIWDVISASQYDEAGTRQALTTIAGAHQIVPSYLDAAILSYAAQGDWVDPAAIDVSDPVAWANRINQFTQGKVTKPKTPEDHIVLKAVAMFTGLSVAAVRDPSKYDPSTAKNVERVDLTLGRKFIPTARDYAQAHKVLTAVAQAPYAAPSPTSKTLFRGLRLLEVPTQGDVIDVGPVASFSVDRNQSLEYAKDSVAIRPPPDDHKRRACLLVIPNATRGVYVGSTSAYPIEEEVISGGKYRVFAIKNSYTQGVRNGVMTLDIPLTEIYLEAVEDQEGTMKTGQLQMPQLTHEQQLQQEISDAFDQPMNPDRDVLPQQSKIAMPMPSQLPAGWRLKAPPTLAGDYYIMTPENIPAAWLRLVKPRYSPTEAYVARVENNYVDTVPGLGAYLYQHVMDKATREGVWLRSDTQVSDKARGVWKKFHDREDVVKEPRDNLPGDPGSIWKFDPKNLDADEDAGPWEPEAAPELFHKYKLKIS